MKQVPKIPDTHRLTQLEIKLLNAVQGLIGHHYSFNGISFTQNGPGSFKGIKYAQERPPKK